MDLQEKYIVKKVTHPHAITAEVPGSKSITNRALLIAALATGKSVLHGVLFSDDSRHFLTALADLGFDVEINEAARVVAITGCGGQIPKKEATVNVGSAGTAARFLTAFLGLSNGRYRMDSSEQMKKRPMRELLTALEALGTEVTYEEEKYHFPYIIGRKCNSVIPDEITIDIDKSSQFLSALLIVSVLFPQGLTIHVTGSHGMAYVKMTVEMMRQFGLAIEVSEDERTYHVTAGASYQPRDYRIEPDLSAACYFYAAGAVLGVPAKVLHVHKDSLQGDIQFLSVLCDMGCEIREDEDGITILPLDYTQRTASTELDSTETDSAGTYSTETDSAGTYSTETDSAGIYSTETESTEVTSIGTSSTGKLAGGSWDLSSFSDQALTLAAIAPFADSMVEIRGVGHIRYQECDRIQAILENLRAMGVQCKEEDGTIRIFPPLNLHGTEIQTYEDHRVAMAFAIPGLLLGNQVILNPACCRKTFENFFEVLEDVVY